MITKAPRSIVSLAYSLIGEVIKMLVNKPINQSVNQSISQSIDKSLMYILDKPIDLSNDDHQLIYVYLR